MLKKKEADAVTNGKIPQTKTNKKKNRIIKNTSPAKYLNTPPLRILAQQYNLNYPEKDLQSHTKR